MVPMTSTGNILKNAYVIRNIGWADDIMRQSHRRTLVWKDGEYEKALSILRYAKEHNLR